MDNDTQTEVNDIMRQDANKGVPVHSFDATQSPNEKGAAAGKGREKLKSAQPGEGAGGEELHIQTASPSALPTIIIQDTEQGSKATSPGTSQPLEIQRETADIPGTYHHTHAPSIPDWYRVGWRQMAGIDDALPEGEDRDRGILHMFLAEQFYGDWYHNAAVIVCAVLVSHFLTRFNFGWGWLFIVLAFSNTYYTASLERTRRRARDDIQRELIKTRLISEHESADWINNFLDRFWLIYEPVLSATIVSSVDQILSTNTPTFLDSLRLTQFTLGTKAPRIDKVRTFPKTEQDIVMMDWGISFTPNDVSDLTPRQLATKVNPKVVLSVRLGKGLATASMPILVEDISFTGFIRIRMKLMANFPHIQTVEFCFLEKPKIDYVLKPIGGETFGFDIGNIPGLSSFIREMTHATLGPMMYDPNVFTLDLEQMLSGKPLDAAVGVIQITLHSARGIKGTKIGGGTPDPYVSLTIEDRAELARSKVQNDTFNPTWMETKFLLVNSLKDSLVLNLWDYNEHRKDTHLGSSRFELFKLLEDATQEGICSAILKDGKDRGELKFDVSYYSVLEKEDGQELPETSVGIVRLTLHQAKELDASNALSGDLNPLAKVFLGNSGTAAHATPAFKHTISPVWESPYEFLCSNKASSVITIRVIDDRDFLKDPVVGYMSIRLTDLLAVTGQSGRDWLPLSGCKSGKIRLSAEWKPLSMAGSIEGAEQYKPPIGVARLLLDKATDVKNVEAMLGGKSDPYIRVLVNNVTKARTEVISNNLNPVWNQIAYIPVHSLRENLLLECMDYQHLTKDRSLGTVELHINELARQREDFKYPYEGLESKVCVEPIRLEGDIYKGQLHYKAEFISALALNGVNFDPSGQASQNEHDNPEVTIKASNEGAKEPRSPTSPTSTSAGRKSPSSASDSSHTASKDVSTSKDGDHNIPKGIDMSIEELLTHQSGIIVINVISGTISKKARLEVLLDDGYWPCFTTIKATSTRAHWAHVGEGFIKELDWSQVWLRLNEADEGDTDDILSQWKGDTKPFLRSTLSGAQNFTLVDENGENSSTISLEARYVPVPVKLEPRETVNNQGTFRIELLNAQGLHAADRGGKSDPYVIFSLNEHKIFKSATKKKTLNPEWNEDFTFEVSSRVDADFKVEVFDWDQIGKAESLGAANVDLTQIDPFQAAEKTLDLVSDTHGKQGHIRIRLLFQPQIIAKSRKNTSTFSTAGRAMTQFGALPVTAGKGVFHGVTGVFKRDPEESSPQSGPASQSAGLSDNLVTTGKDVFHGVTGVFKKADHGEQHKGAKELTPSGQASQPVGLSDKAGDNNAGGLPIVKEANGVPGPHKPGALRVTVLSAKDLCDHESRPYVVLRLGDKECKTRHLGKTTTPEWKESFTFIAGSETPRILVWVYDHKTLGKDKDLGEGEVDVWRHIQPQGVLSSDVTLELRQGGQLQLRLEFDPNANPGASRTSFSSGERIKPSSIIPSPSRFSIGRSRRPAVDGEE